MKEANIFILFYNKKYNVLIISVIMVTKPHDYMKKLKIFKIKS